MTPQPQVQGWKTGPPTLAPPTRAWAKGTKRFFWIADDGTALGGEDAVVGAVGEEAALSLQAEVAIEIAGDADDGAGIDGLVLIVVDVAVDRVKVAVAAIEVEARGIGRGSSTGLDGLGCHRGRGGHREGCDRGSDQK